MAEKINPLLPSEQDMEHSDPKSEAEVNTNSLSPEAARRFKRFTTLVDRFEKAASSGALLPPVSASGSSH